jgi:hypothetical protein
MTIIPGHDTSHVIIKSLYDWSTGNNTPREVRRELTFRFGEFFEKNARVQANNAQVQAINAVHPGVDAVNCTVLSNGMCHTRAHCILHT